MILSWFSQVLQNSEIYRRGNYASSRRSPDKWSWGANALQKFVTLREANGPSDETDIWSTVLEDRGGVEGGGEGVGASTLGQSRKTPPPKRRLKSKFRRKRKRQ